MTLRHTNAENAREILKAANGQLRVALQPSENPS
jgi:hypothetical protein